MFKDKLAMDMKGRVRLTFYDDKGIRRTSSIPNAIQAQAKEIAAKRLIQHPSSVIDTISLYNGVNLLKAGPITVNSIVSSTEVMFEAVFAPGDFNSSFTEARLIASGIGNFSIVQNLVASKDSTESLLVTWSIQII